MTSPLKLDKRGKLSIPEANVQEAGDDLMEAHGWRCYPQPVNLHCPHCGANIPVSGAEKSQPDRLYIRPYAPATNDRPACCATVIVFVEYKKLGKKPTREQQAYHENLRREGFKVLVISSVEQLAEWLGVKLGRR